MCVLMVCFNVLELLLDETAMPRGMEVRKETFHASCAAASHLCTLAIIVFVCFRTHTLGWPPSPCLVHSVLQFK